MARQKSEATERIAVDEGNILRQNHSIQVEGASVYWSKTEISDASWPEEKLRLKHNFFLLAFAFNINKLHNRTIYKRLGIELFDQEAA